MSPQALAGTLAPEAASSGMRRMFAYLGPATLVSVGYVDPGNWATDLEAGAHFSGQLLWVLVAANAVAMLMQTLAARLGIVSRLDLAQGCRVVYSRPVVIVLFVLCEIAIVACDLAEVIGSAVALNMLFGLPMAWGAAITVADVFALLALQRFGVRRLEALVLVLVLTVGTCLALEFVLAGPPWAELASALHPRLDSSSVYVAVAILGATVMPHNLFLHSWLVKSRVAPATAPARRRALRYNLLDTILALNVAFCINAALLLLAAKVFHGSGLAISDLREAQRLLSPLLGTGLAGALFAIALLAAGQSSTITGTLAGQVVMQGFLQLRGSPAAVRLATRAVAVVPAVFALAVLGDDSTVWLLIITQVVLSLQLPFALVPLIRLTSEPALMGEHVNSRALAWSAWVATALVIICNGWLVASTLSLPSPALRVLAAFSGAAAIWLLCHLALVPLRGISPSAEPSQGDRESSPRDAFSHVLGPN